MGAKTITSVPIKHVLPAPDMVLVRQHTTDETDGGLHLPERAKEVVHVAVKVGEEVKHVQEGDIVLLHGAADISALPQVKELCAIIPGDAIGGVIRRYDWKATAPKLVTPRRS